ncbi:MAG TPA: zinc-dependent metalloprotease, partial [Lacibacter sp.]|nr:zinc-dependent metalloprotease [Lacibacter sp.]
QDFPAGTNEKTALNNIITEANKRGLQFISDRDARAPGGLHPQAHLWDNGANAAEELKEVMKVRAKALNDFGEKNIRPGMPMAMLEDALVPVYFYHRYQIEAATKLVGGMFYNYALRGDGQIVTKLMSKTEQIIALNAIVDCIDPKVLQVPDRIAAMIPPRPSGYISSRELFRKRTGLSFDQLSPAETAADLPFSFLFNSERLSRMVQLETKGGLGVAEMIQLLIDKTWKAPRRTGMEALIQQQTEQVLLTYLLASSVDENNSYAVRGVLTKALNDLKKYIDLQNKTAAGTYAGHLQLATERMKNPSAAKPTIHKEAPPGAPIGCED